MPRHRRSKRTHAPKVKPTTIAIKAPEESPLPTDEENYPLYIQQQKTELEPDFIKTLEWFNESGGRALSCYGIDALQERQNMLDLSRKVIIQSRMVFSEVAQKIKVVLERNKFNPDQLKNKKNSENLTALEQFGFELKYYEFKASLNLFSELEIEGEIKGKEKLIIFDSLVILSLYRNKHKKITCELIPLKQLLAKMMAIKDLDEEFTCKRNIIIENLSEEYQELIGIRELPVQSDVAMNGTKNDHLTSTYNKLISLMENLTQYDKEFRSVFDSLTEDFAWQYELDIKAINDKITAFTKGIDFFEIDKLLQQKSFIEFIQLSDVAEGFKTIIFLYAQKLRILASKTLYSTRKIIEVGSAKDNSNVLNKEGYLERLILVGNLTHIASKYFKLYAQLNPAKLILPIQTWLMCLNQVVVYNVSMAAIKDELESDLKSIEICIEGLFGDIAKEEMLKEDMAANAAAEALIQEEKLNKKNKKDASKLSRKPKAKPAAPAVCSNVKNAKVKRSWRASFFEQKGNTSIEESNNSLDKQLAALWKEFEGNKNLKSALSDLKKNLDKVAADDKTAMPFCKLLLVDALLSCWEAEITTMIRIQRGANQDAALYEKTCQEADLYATEVKSNLSEVHSQIWTWQQSLNENERQQADVLLEKLKINTSCLLAKTKAMFSKHSKVIVDHQQQIVQEKNKLKRLVRESLRRRDQRKKDYEKEFGEGAWDKRPRYRGSKDYAITRSKMLHKVKELDKDLTCSDKTQQRIVYLRNDFGNLINAINTLTITEVSKLSPYM